MNFLAGYRPERILSVLNQFTDVDYCIPSCQMVWQTLLVCLLLCYNILTTMELGFFSLRLVWDSLLPSPTLYNDVQIVVPVLVDNIWCAYMFDTHGANVYVLDPAHASSRYQVHVEIHKMLHDALSNCLGRFFEGWSLKPNFHWALHYPELSPGDVTKYVLLAVVSSLLILDKVTEMFGYLLLFFGLRDDSGIVMLHYVRTFNGDHLEEPLNKVTQIFLFFHFPCWVCCRIFK